MMDWFKRIFDLSMFLGVWHFTINPVLKSTNIKSMQRQLSGVLCLLMLFFNIMPYNVNIIKVCSSILFTAFTCSAWMYCCSFITFTTTLYYSLLTTFFWWFKREVYPFCFYFFTPWLLTEVICPVIPLLLLRLINESKWFMFCARDRAILAHKIVRSFPERGSFLGAADCLNNFLYYTYQYQDNTAVGTFLGLMIMIERIETMQIPYHDIRSMI